MTKINIWLQMNKLKLNEEKTKIMTINMNNNELFKINNKVIEEVTCLKYLGFMIDNKLKFDDHINYICRKISKTSKSAIFGWAES